MRRFFKWMGIVVGSVLVIGFVAYLIIYFTTDSRINRVYHIDAPEIVVAVDAETIERGEYLATLFGCNGCHGENLAGEPLIEEPVLGMVYATNLTAGEGGVLNDYTDSQLSRAIRHGIDKDGHPLLIMPSTDFAHLSDQDTAALIAYMRSMPDVDNVRQPSTLGPLGRVLLAFDMFPAFPAEVIDHSVVYNAAPEQGVTVEYGKYLAAACQGCHMADFAGGPQLGGGPNDIPSANLTVGGELAEWSTEDFINTIRTGVNPSGRQLDVEMPWQAYARMTDEELTAIFLFLQSLPPVASNG